MVHSVTEGMKLVSVDAVLPDSCQITEVTVTGFDREGISRSDIKSALRKHFGSCGVVTDVSLSHRRTIESYAWIYILGEGALEKVLQLDPIDLAGQNISVTAKLQLDSSCCYSSLRVDGFDHSLGEKDIKVALEELFSSYHRVFQVVHCKGSVILFLSGRNLKKATELSGSVIGGCKLTIRPLSGLHADVRVFGGPRVGRIPYSLLES